MNNCFDIIQYSAKEKENLFCYSINISPHRTVDVVLTFLLITLNIRPAILFKKGSGTGVFLKFCEISKNTVWHRTHLVAGSEQSKTQESKT